MLLTPYQMNASLKKSGGETMFGIGLPELLIILFIVLIIFGASRLPEIGSGLGQGIRNFRKAFKSEDKTIDITSEKELEEKDKKP